MSNFIPSLATIRQAASIADRVVAAFDSVSAPIQQVADSIAATASVLPGIRITGLDVPVEVLRDRFPASSDEELGRASAVLAGVFPSAATSKTWLEFGYGAQEGVAKLVGARLQLKESSAARSVGQHLAKVHELMTDVLNAFEGGLFRRSPAAVWSQVQPQLKSLDRRLASGCGDLSGQLRALELQLKEVPGLNQQLSAHSLAAEYLAATQPAAAGVLTGRMVALTESLVLLREHEMHLSQDIEGLQELITFVNAGVLVKLPALQTQLAAWIELQNDTERFDATEKLHDVIRVIKDRKLP